MKQIIEIPETSSENQITIEDLIIKMENTSVANFNNHKGGKMRIIKRRFGKFMHASMIASQLEIKA